MHDIPQDAYPYTRPLENDYLKYRERPLTYGQIGQIYLGLSEQALESPNLDLIMHLGDIALDASSAANDKREAAGWVELAAEHFAYVTDTIDRPDAQPANIEEKVARLMVRACLKKVDIHNWSLAAQGLPPESSYNDFVAAAKMALPYAARTPEAWSELSAGVLLILALRAGVPTGRLALRKEIYGNNYADYKQSWKVGLAATATAAAFLNPPIKLQIRHRRVRHSQRYEAGGVVTMNAISTGLNDLEKIVQLCTYELEDSNASAAVAAPNPDSSPYAELAIVTQNIESRIRALPPYNDYRLKPAPST